MHYSKLPHIHDLPKILKDDIPLRPCSEIERQNPQTAASDELTGVHRSKRQWVVCCICRQNSRCLHESSNCPWLDKKTSDEPDASKQLKCFRPILSNGGSVCHPLNCFLVEIVTPLMGKSLSYVTNCPLPWKNQWCSHSFQPDCETRCKSALKSTHWWDTNSGMVGCLYFMAYAIKSNQPTKSLWIVQLVTWHNGYRHLLKELSREISGGCKFNPDKQGILI